MGVPTSVAACTESLLMGGWGMGIVSHDVDRTWSIDWAPDKRRDEAMADEDVLWNGRTWAGIYVGAVHCRMRAQQLQ